MRRKRRAGPTVAGAVGRFALAGLVALGVVGAVSFLVMRQTGTDEALKNARSLTHFVGQGIVEPNLSERLVEGDPAALARFDRLIRQPRPSGTDRAGQALDRRSGGSSIPTSLRLIGERYTLGADEIAALRSGNVESDIGDLTRPGESLRARPRKAARGLPTRPKHPRDVRCCSRPTSASTPSPRTAVTSGWHSHRR